MGRIKIFLQIINITVFAAGLILTPAAVIFGQEAVDAPLNATPEQIAAALQDLSTATDQSINSVEQAHEFCNQEQYFDECAEIGKKHNLYSDEEKQAVDAVLAVFRDDVAQQLKDCFTEECLIKVANLLSRRLSAGSPAVARDLGLTLTDVSGKKAIIDAARETGVALADCQNMDPETASIELLRACARLAKDSRVNKGLSEEARRSADFNDEFLNAYQTNLFAGCGEVAQNFNQTLENCGDFCFDPEKIKKGGSAIPPVCLKLASTFFADAGGEQALRDAYGKLARESIKIDQYYRNQGQKIILTTPDGQRISGEGAIRSACDQAFSNRNLPLAEACGDFAVRNGFATQAEMKAGLEFLRTFQDKNVNLNDCAVNPEACEQYLSREEKNRFSESRQIEAIITRVLGSSAVECDKSPELSQRCHNLLPNAIPELEALAAKGNREAQGIANKLKQAQTAVTAARSGGPGGCKSSNECYEYCSDPKHTPECIAFGARHEIFDGDDAVRRYTEFNDAIFTDQPNYERYPDYRRSAVFGPPYPPDPNYGQPHGPSPECFRAIQEGDFIRAKELCAGASCPQAFFQPCPNPGEYRLTVSDDRGCQVPAPVCESGDPNRQVCPALPTVDPRSCVNGAFVTFESRECGTFYGCKSPGEQSTACLAGFHEYPDGSGNEFCMNDTDDRNGPCFELNSSVRIRCPDEGITAGNCPNSHHFHTKDPGFCMPNSENPAEGCLDGHGTQRIACPAIPLHTYSGPIIGPVTVPFIPQFQCSDQKDNDNDGKIDWPADPSCSDRYDNDEYFPTTSGGGVCDAKLKELLGPDCHNMGNAYFDGPMNKYVFPGTNSVKDCAVSYIPNCSGGGVGKMSCSDGLDNDGDGQIDYPADTGCYGYGDSDEKYADSGSCGSHGPGAHNMDSTGNCFDSSMFNYWKPDGSGPNPCTGTDLPVYGCSGSIGSSCSCPSDSYGVAGGGSSIPTYCVSNSNSSLCGTCGSSSVSNFTTSQCQTSGGSCTTDVCCQALPNSNTVTGFNKIYDTQYQGCDACVSSSDCRTGYTCDSIGNCIVSGSYQCSDGTDNDGDGLKDYPTDPGCYSSTDNTETSDSGCGSYTSQSTCTANACAWDSVGNYCFTGGGSCSSYTSSSNCEADTTCDWINNTTCRTVGSYESEIPGGCTNGIDDDKDGLIDSADPACYGGGDCSTKYGSGAHTMDSTGRCFNSNMTQYWEADGTGSFACTGSNTPVSGCSSGDSCNYNNVCDPNESSATCSDCGSKTQCSDSIDNDGDTKIDYPSDPDCTNSSDTTETPDGGGCSTYGSGWHSMDSSGRCFNSGMSEYRESNGGGPYQCTGTDAPVYGCSGSGGYCGDGSCGSNESSSSCPADCGGGPPSAPTGFSGSGSWYSGFPTGNVTLSWTSNPSANITEIKVFRNGSLLTSYPASGYTSSYSDNSVPAGTYNYTIQACNASGCSADSASASVTLTEPPPPPPPPEPPPPPPPGAFLTPFCPDGHNWNGSHCLVTTTQFAKAPVNADERVANFVAQINSLFRKLFSFFGVGK